MSYNCATIFTTKISLSLEWAGERVGTQPSVPKVEGTAWFARSLGKLQSKKSIPFMLAMEAFSTHQNYQLVIHWHVIDSHILYLLLRRRRAVFHSHFHSINALNYDTRDQSPTSLHS